MKHNQGFKVESNKITKMVTKAFMLNVFAEEQPPQETNTQAQTPENAPQPQSSVINYEDLITKARREEHAKVQGKIDKLTNENKTLVEKNNGLMLKVGQLESEKASLENDIKKAKEGGAKIESEEIKSLNAEIKTLKDKIKTMEANAVDVDEIEKGIKAEYDLKIFKMEKIHEAGKEIIPELVMGTTQEEILASIEKSKERYKEIVGNVTPNTNNSQQAIGGGIQVPNMPTGNVDTNTYAMGNINPDSIRSMSPTEWAEYRKKLGIK